MNDNIESLPNLVESALTKFVGILDTTVMLSKLEADLRSTRHIEQAIIQISHARRNVEAALTSITRHISIVTPDRGEA